MEIVCQAHRGFKANSGLTELGWARHERGQSDKEYAEDAKHARTQRGMESDREEKREKDRKPFAKYSPKVFGGRNRRLNRPCGLRNRKAENREQVSGQPE